MLLGIFFYKDWFKLLVALWVIRATWWETDLCTVRPNPGRGEGVTRNIFGGWGVGGGVFGSPNSDPISDQNM